MHDPWLMLGVFLLAVFGTAIVGGCVGSWLTLRHLSQAKAEPADAFDAVEEETSDEPVVKPELAWWFTAETAPATLFDSLGLASARTHRRTVSWPVPAPDELKNDTTRRIVLRQGEGDEGAPWWAGPTCEVTRESWGGRHDPQCQAESITARPAPGFLGEFATTETPRLDWSSHPTASVPEVQVGRHRSGEYPVLDGVS